MADRDSNSHTGRTVALVGGGAFLAWMLLRGKGWGLGGSGGPGSGGGGSGSADAGVDAGTGATTGAHPELRAPCRVFIRARQIDLDGSPADLASIVTRCRASGQADVRATGGASVKAMEDVFHALQAAGVVIHAN